MQAPSDKKVIRNGCSGFQTSSFTTIKANDAELSSIDWMTGLGHCFHFISAKSQFLPKQISIESIVNKLLSGHHFALGFLDIGLT